MNFLKYNVLINNYSENRFVEVYENCNGYTVLNVGDSDMLVNGILLHKGTPTSMGESITFGGNAGEVFNGRIDISFIPGGVAPMATIIQKIYL